MTIGNLGKGGGKAAVSPTMATQKDEQKVAVKDEAVKDEPKPMRADDHRDALAEARADLEAAAARLRKLEENPPAGTGFSSDNPGARTQEEMERDRAAADTVANPDAPTLHEADDRPTGLRPQRAG